MTALREYERLESGGLWRENADAQRRNVVVSFGDTTLVMSDTAGRTLTHWSLPAVRRLNADQMPAIFTPGEDAAETLEIDDDLMVAAIEKVRKSVHRQRPRSGRLRWIGMGVSVAAVIALAVFWLPEALIRQSIGVVPAVKRSEIGATLLGHIQRVTGSSCRNALGVQALGRLKSRTLGPASGGQIVVVPGGVNRALYLPGGLIVLNKSLVEDTQDPATAAGHILSAAGQLRVADPLAVILRHAGPGATIRLLTTGDIPSNVLRDYAEALIADPPPIPPDDVLLALFAGAQISSTPFAYAVDVTGERTIGLIEADPLQGVDAPEVLGDGDWISLQGICS